MTTLRRTAIHILGRRAALQCLGLGALAMAWPPSAGALAFEQEEPADLLPAWLTFPEQQWQRITPAEAGIDTVAYEKLLAQSQIGPKGWGGTQPDNRQWGAVLTRGGYLVETWGDPTFKTQSASLGKCITRALIGISAERGRLKLDEPISATWTGRGQLSHEHKCLDQGHHARLTWRQLINHQGGFVLESGYHWRTGTEFHGVIPPWATTTRDPLYDNYAHGEPGHVTHYSSGGYWRLGQALTALWDQDLKQVVQDELFSHLGIPVDRWDWLPGKVVHDTRDFYPAFPGYGEYVDPPYEINGHVVRGAPGWFVISSEDLARFGLLVATGGRWKDKQLVAPGWLQGHAGLDIHVVAADPQTMVSIAKTNTGGFPFGVDVGTSGDFAFPAHLITGPVTRRKSQTP
ncbi:MAG: serine hydrolase domain-containing protein [Pirellulaceae bacterium]